MSNSCKHCIITGLVQGVWYRASTKEIADSLGVTGWVRNLGTGQVECVISGSEEQLNNMVAWLHDGPPMAEVKSVDVDDAPDENFTSFDIR